MAGTGVSFVLTALMTVPNRKATKGMGEGGGGGTSLVVVVSSWVMPRKLKPNASAKELTEHQNDHRECTTTSQCFQFSDFSRVSDFRL